MYTTSRPKDPVLEIHSVTEVRLKTEPRIPRGAAIQATKIRALARAWKEGDTLLNMTPALWMDVISAA